MVRAFEGSILALALVSWFWPSPADAHGDLDLRNVHVHRVNSCTNELKFKVKFRRIPSLTHGHVGPDPGATYNIVVNARTASGEAPLRSFPVRDQPLGSTIAFVVPSGARMCRDTLSRLQHYETVVIHVDSGSAIDESNKENNVKVKHWGIQQGGPLSLPACYRSADFDPPPCQ